MKINKSVIGMVSMVAAIAFTACTNDEADFQQDVPTKGNVISLTSQLAQTRAASDPQTNALNTTNKVGVFVTNSSAAITNGENNEHSVGTDGALTTNNVMNYPAENGAKVNIYAYAPYAAGTTLSSDNNFSVATDQSTETGYLASDLVYAKVEDQASSTEAVSLTFAHKLSQLQITIQNDANVDLSNASVVIAGTNVAATFNPSTGAVAAASTADVKDIKAIATLGTGTQAYAILVPQTIAANTELVKIKTSEKTYIAKLATETTLEAGKAYSFTVKLAAETVELKLTGTSITEWGTPTSLGDATMEEETVEVTSPLYATFGTPGSNASYDASTFKYKWTGTTNNVMQCFSFSNGELAYYKTLKFTFSELSGGSVRINILFSDNKNVNTNTGFYSAGEKTITLSELNLKSSDNTEHTLADVTAIRFAGNTIGDGHSEETTVIKASEMYLEK